MTRDTDGRSNVHADTMDHISQKIGASAHPFQRRMQAARNLGNPLHWPRLIRLLRSPIVIGGCGRSGTSLLLSVLSCHPEIFPIPFESRALCPGEYDCKSDHRTRLDHRFLLKYILASRLSPRHRHWCEKTPKNIQRIPQILTLFGRHVKIIHIVRDVRDVLLSKHPSDPTRSWVSLGRWVSDVTAGREYENHPQVYTLRYEDLVQDYATEVSKLCLFLEIPFATEMLNYPETAQINEHVAWSGGAQPIQQSSVGKWRTQTKDILEDSTSENSLAIELLRHYRYPI